MVSQYRGTMGVIVTCVIASSTLKAGFVSSGGLRTEIVQCRYVTYGPTGSHTKIVLYEDGGVRTVGTNIDGSPYEILDRFRAREEENKIVFESSTFRLTLEKGTSDINDVYFGKWSDEAFPFSADAPVNVTCQLVEDFDSHIIW